ncbi:hypothetical protein N9Y26_01425 [bacterium]|nr:hypothetical protein [bacterium]
MGHLAIAQYMLEHTESSVLNYLTLLHPFQRTLCEEIFGPVITIYVYEPKDFHRDN